MFEEKDLKEDTLDWLNICIKQCRDSELNYEGTETLNLIKENYEATDNSKIIKTNSIDILDQIKIFSFPFGKFVSNKIKFNIIKNIYNLKT